ncbi:MAG: hypothetical protein Q3997_06760 [Propionibacteriaceae bacterium]|nr:hypothetical protein [Propionibacteriaceae bacterium]
MEVVIYLAVFAVIGLSIGIERLLHRRRMRKVRALEQAFPVLAVKAPWQLVRFVAEVGDTPGQPSQIRCMVAERQTRPRPSRRGTPTRRDDDGSGLLDRVLFGEFRYSIRTGKSRSYFDLGFFYYPLPASFPLTRIRPARLFPRIGDIHTEWEQFNRTVDVQSESRQFALALLQPRMQELLCYQLRDLQLTLFSGGLLLIAPSWEVSDYPVLRSFAAEFERRIVSFLWEDFG